MKGVVFTFKRKPKREKFGKNHSGKSDLKYMFKHYSSVFFFTFMLILGLTLGSVFFNKISDSALSKLDVFFLTNISQRVKNGFLGAFSAGFASNFMFLLVVFLLGLSLWGMLFLPFVVMFKGFGIGISAGYLFTNFGIKGMIFYLVILIPGIFLFSMALVYQSATAFSMGKRLMGKVYSKSDFSFITPTKLYLHHSFRYLLLAVFSAVIDMALWGVFGGLFNFS